MTSSPRTSGLLRRGALAGGVLVVVAVTLLDLLALAQELRLIAALGVALACAVGALASRRLTDRLVLSVLAATALLLAAAAAARLRPQPWVFALYGPTLAALGVACYRLWRLLKDDRAVQVARRRQRLLDVEQERARLARELHDDPLQQLASIGFALERAVRTAQPDAAVVSIGQAQDGLAEVILAIRGLLDDLAPPDLSRYGLAGSLEMLVERVQVASEGEVALELDMPAGTAPLPQVVALAGYRIAQQATANALRHADAEQITVRLEQTAATLTLAVIDDGRGFQATGPGRGHGPGHGHGHGLRTMRENAEVAGGQLRLSTAPGRGCTLLLTVALASVGAAEAGGPDRA